MPCLAATAPDAPYDVVVFLLDDARFDQLDRLAETSGRLADRAVVFERAYVTTPLCAPARASLLSGGYAPRATGVLGNEAPNGGASVFDAHDTLITRLQAAGTTTALLGKYMNEVDLLGDAVPPGWSVWEVTPDAGPWTDPTLWVGESAPDAPGTAVERTVDAYVTDWQASRAREILAGAGEDPVFLLVSFLAPHHPHIPAPEDEGALAGYLWRERAWEEADLSDKPAWVRAEPLLDEDGLAQTDQNNQERLETLLSVDRAMASVVDEVEALGRTDRTVFVITSDNGQLWREHRLTGKGVAYEESVRVPLLVAAPGLAPRAEQALVAANLDLGATLSALAGLEPEGDGQDLRPLLCGASEGGREAIVLQGWPGDAPGWAAVVTAEDKLVLTAGGEREYYRLDLDPYEEESATEDAEDAARLAELEALLEPELGLVITTDVLPPAQQGSPYEAALETWGGVAPLRFALSEGALPEGLALTDAGLIVGTPTEAGTARLVVTVEDASASAFDGTPQTWSVGLKLEVAAADAKAADGCGCGAGAGARPWAALIGALAALARRRGPAHRAGAGTGSAGAIRRAASMPQAECCSRPTE